MRNKIAVIGRTLDGRYHILSKLGQGAFGQTYLAEDMKLPGKKHCVVKHLQPQARDKVTLQAAKKLFKREAEVLNKLGSEHPQIPQLLAYFEEKGEFYLVQELIKGKDLSQEIAAGKQLSEAEVVDILAEVLDILAFVHGQNAIHRDIKPSNIMRRESDGQLVLIDFGAVKELATQVIDNKGLTTITVAIGTLGYLPSEQALGSPQLSSDLYSLGILAIFALTGIEPRQIKKNPEVIWRDENQVSDDLGDFIDRLVRYNFRDRYFSAVEAKAALQEIIKVPPTFVPNPIQKTQRSRFLSVRNIVATTILLLTVGGGGYFYLNNLRSPEALLLTYENTDYGIEVDYPDNWILEKSEDPFGTLARFFPEKSQGESLVTIEVENIDSNISLDDYTTDAISKITQYLPEARILSSQPISLGERSAHQVIYTGKNRRMDFTSKYLQVWFLESNQAYIFTYLAPSDRYQDFVGTVEKFMIPSWEVGEDFK